jgi:hypothetical protein
MKPIYVLFTALVILVSCKKKESTPKDNTPDPTTPAGPTIIKKFGYGLPGDPPGNVYAATIAGQNLTSESGGTEVYIHNHVAYTFEVNTTYQVKFQKLVGGPTGTLYQSNADVKFDAQGNMTVINDYAHSALWKDSVLQSGESIIYFYIP